MDKMILRREKNILIEEFDEQILVFDLDRNLPYVLNGVAACILMHTDGVSDQETIARRVCEEFDVDFSRALEDIRGLHEEFLARQIVQPVPPRIRGKVPEDHCCPGQEKDTGQ